MSALTSRLGSPVPAAMTCAAVVGAQFVAGKATRDALYLAQLDVTSLPVIVVASSAASVLLVLFSSRTLRRIPPSVFVPALFISNSLLLLIAWGLSAVAPAPAAVAVFLLCSGLGPMLGSGFWLIASEQFDPQTAKARFGHIAAVGTLGGLFGGLSAARLSTVLPVSAMLPVLAAMSLVGAWQVRRLAEFAVRGGATAVDAALDLSAAPVRSGLQVLAKVPYLRDLAGVVFLGAIGAALVDYLFKVEAVAAFGRSDGLLRYFAIYYAATSAVTFVVQTSFSRWTLTKLGLGVSAATPSAALVVGGLVALVGPGFQGIVAARAGESVFRASLFRAGYELFYTPILPAEKRAAKSLIDVGVDRLGDAAGGGLIRVLLVLGPALRQDAIIIAAIVCSAGALILTGRLKRGYVQTLERGLLSRAIELDVSDSSDVTTRTAILRTMSGTWSLDAAQLRALTLLAATRQSGATVAGTTDVGQAQIAALRSHDPERVLAVLRAGEPLPAVLVPHVVALVALDRFATEAMTALRRVAEEHVGQLTDMLIDPNQPFAVRRRLARVLSTCVSQRAVDGLVLGLDDLRFEVRFHCGRALAVILDKNPRVRIDQAHTFELVRLEVAAGRDVWESRRLLDRLDDHDPSALVDQLVSARADKTLAHVFTLLSLVLPAQPLLIAFRALQTDDRNLRGTAFEYLESVLPPDTRNLLWPFLENSHPTRGNARPREAIVEDLLRSHPSISLSLEELNRRSGAMGEDKA